MSKIRNWLFFSLILYKIIPRYRLIFRTFLGCWHVNPWFLKRSSWKPMVLMPVPVLYFLCWAVAIRWSKRNNIRIKSYLVMGFLIFALIFTNSMALSLYTKIKKLRKYLHIQCKVAFLPFSPVIWMLISEKLRYSRIFV